ncbi:MAG TPA: tetratricopeptide repeat protein [Blastocatellia bacterium]|nr:tetratricopeptide repeat protein [Blastocatellia bacterium]
MTKRQRAQKKPEHRFAETSRNLSRGWVVGLILSLTFVAFFNTLFNGFAYDDTTQILANPFIQDLSNIPTAMVTEAWFWRAQEEADPNEAIKPTTPYYRPTVLIYMMFGWMAFGDWAPGWHLMNILMHMIVVYLVFSIMEKVTKDVRVAAIGAILFAVHPLRSESIAWISGFTDPILAIFLLGAFYLYMLYRERNSLGYLAAGLALFVCAAFTKEPAVSLPIFIAAYEVFIVNQDKPLRARVREAALMSAIFILASVIYFVMRRYALGFWLNDTTYARYSNVDILMTIPLVITKYIGLLFWPVNLSLFHETPMVQSALSVRFILPLLFVIALASGLWRLRHSLVARFAIIWFGINLLPVMNLGAFAESFMVQERYLYLPSVGFSLLVAVGLAKLPVEQWLAIGTRRTAQAAVIVVIVLLFTGKTIAQNTVWKDDLTLWTHGVEAAPDQTMSYYVLGTHYVKEGRADKIVETYEQYVKLDPDNVSVLSNLAAAHLLVYEGTRERAHIDRAIALCERGLKMEEDLSTLWDTLGRAYTFETEMKNLERARACFARALKAQPDNAMFNFHMGAVYVKENKFDMALPYLELAKQRAPELVDTYKFLAYAYANKNQLPQAIESLSEYLRRNPNASDAPSESVRLQQLRSRLQNQTQNPQS